jgi:signal transduction histidine kinase
MLLLLNIRSRQLKKDGLQASLQLELTQIELTSERRQREDQNRFMAMLSHELKTPLSVIRMALGMQAPTATVQRHAQQSVADMDAVVERCLQVDQLEQQQLTSAQQVCHVEDLLISLCDASAAPQRFVIQAQALPTIKTDPQLLHIALGNLIDNAFKYADDEKKIQIEACPSEQQAQHGIFISVSNAPGHAGMPDPQRVFAKYYRSPGALRKTGSGLGLYLVRGTIEQLGGWVRYTPSVNEVRFELWIPC